MSQQYAKVLHKQIQQKQILGFREVQCSETEKLSSTEGTSMAPKLTSKQSGSCFVYTL